MMQTEYGTLLMGYNSNIMNWLKENWFKVGILVILSLTVSTFLYKTFVTDSNNQAFDNCLKSYDSTWREALSGKPYFLSVSELCASGYGFSEFLKIARGNNAKIEAEYKTAYADTDNYWIQEKMVKEKSDTLRTILFPN